MKQVDGKWRRDAPTALGPNRAFGGYYRSADRVIAGKVFRGVPLHTAEDAVVAAVQMGYRVVDAQIERGMRAAQRLRGAAERRGSGTPADMLDAGERLATKAVLAALQWIETASFERGSPLMRLIESEYRMVGAMLGLRASGGRDQETPDAKEGDESRVGAAGRREDSPPRAPRIILTAPEDQRRPVEVRVLKVREEAITQPLDIRFFLLDAPKVRSFKGNATVSVVEGRVVLAIRTTLQDPGGRWRAAICLPDGEQVGLIEIGF
jgi:hypothetical protein